jgi:hypothetical protein
MIIVLEYIRIKFNDIDYKQRSKQKGQCLRLFIYRNRWTKDVRNFVYYFFLREYIQSQDVQAMRK